jgi:hypothetical protein
MIRHLFMVLLVIAWSVSASADGMIFCAWYQAATGEPYRIRYKSYSTSAATVTTTVTGIELATTPPPVFPDLDKTGKEVMTNLLRCDAKSIRYPDGVEGAIDLNFRSRSNTLFDGNLPLGSCRLHFRCDASGRIEPSPGPPSRAPTD